MALVISSSDDGGRYFVSTDGTTFSTVLLTGCTHVYFQESDLQIGLALTGATAVQRSTNGGTAWTALAAALPRAHRNSCIELANGTILVGLEALAGRGTDIARSTDGGASWSTVSVQASSGIGSSFPIPGTFWETGVGTVLLHDNLCTVYRSTDSGATWSAVYAPGAASGTKLGLTFRNGYAFFGWTTNLFSSRVSRSTDDGQTWTTVLNLGSGELFTGYPVRNLVGFLSTGELMIQQGQAAAATAWVSADQGATWTSTSRCPTTNTIGCYASTAAIYTSHDAGGQYLHYSTNNGTSWSKVAANIDTDMSAASRAWTIYALNPPAAAAEDVFLRVSWLELDIDDRWPDLQPSTTWTRSGRLPYTE